MEILSIIALSLSGLTLLGILGDKIVKEFKERKPESSIVIKSSCCNKKEDRENHSKKDSRDVNCQ